METCGLAKKDVLLELSEKVGLFLYDLKILDPVKHKKYTGVPNDFIVANLEALAQRNKPVIVRFPIIPEINDDNENIREMIALLSRFSSGGFISCRTIKPGPRSTNDWGWVFV